MTIYNLGSINADHTYRVPHLPEPGETLAAHSMQTGLGGKGANMSVAAARAGAHVSHIGAIGSDGIWVRDRLLEYGVDTRHIAQTEAPTGHAIINVDDKGENAITILSGSNMAISEDQIGQALSAATHGDILVLQNETNNQRYAADVGYRMGLRVCYAAAPFESKAVSAVLPFLDFLILNEVEADQFMAETGSNLGDLPVKDIIVTLGSKGCCWIETRTKSEHFFDALTVEPVDTTGAGDTFTGYVLAGLDRGMSMAQSITLATRAAALMVTRVGTADVIPDLKDVENFAGL